MPATTMPCAVCQFPVELRTSRKEMYVDQKARSEGNRTPDGSIAVCSSKRCQRLLFETLNEMNRSKV